MMQQQFNITTLFFEAVRSNPQRIAIVDGKWSVTFGQLSEAVTQTVQYFVSKGIGKGDRVLVFIPMSADLYRVVLALFRIGAVAVFVDEWVSVRRLELCCNIAGCKAVIGGWKVRLLRWVSATIRHIPLYLTGGYRMGGGSAELQDTNSTDTALITFTTGSTGTPKAAMRTHGFLQQQFAALEAELGIRSGQTCVVALPIVLFLNLGMGITSVIASFQPKKRRKLHADRIVSQIGTVRADTLIGSPYFVQQLAAYVLAHQLQMPSLSKIFTGGAPVFPREVRQYMQAFPAADIKIVYGSTESEPISSIAAPDLLQAESLSFREGLCVGVPAAAATVLIIPYREGVREATSDDDLYTLSLPAGTIGEIIVSGPHVLDAYYNNPEALQRNKIFTRERCWHRTGDSGFLRDGVLFLTGRCNTLIYQEGRVLAPFIVENLLQSVSGVAAGTVLQGATGPVILAEPVDGADNEIVVEHILRLNTGITAVKLLPYLPRDPRHYSKIDYEACRSLV